MKRRKKGMAEVKRKISLIVGTAALCAVLLTGCSNPGDEVIKAMTEGNVTQAQRVYSEKISGNRRKEADFRNKAELALNDLIAQYNIGEINEDEVDELFSDYKEMIGSNSVYSNAEKKLNELKSSKFLFDSANKFHEKGNNTTAYELCAMVSESDANYEAAQNLMQQIEQENKEDARNKLVESDALITEAGELLRQGQYKDAMEKNTEGYSLRKDKEGIETIPLQVTKKLAEENGFENPSTAIEEVHNGLYSICIKCDSYKGQDFEKFSKDKIIEIYKEFGKSFETVTRGSGFFLGDIYCNGKWYSVFLSESKNLEDDVTIYADSEKQESQKLNENQNTSADSTVSSSKKDTDATHSDVIANGNGKDRYGHDKFDAFVVAENAVKEKLKSPSTAQFCTTTEATIGRNGNTWTVKGWVDAQNGYGAMVRANFVVTFTFASKNTYSVALCTVS